MGAEFDEWQGESGFGRPRKVAPAGAGTAHWGAWGACGNREIAYVLAASTPGGKCEPRIDDHYWKGPAGMPETPLNEVLRRVIREDVGMVVGERLDSLEERVKDGFARTEEQSEGVGQRFPDPLTGVEDSEAIVAQWLDRLGFEHSRLDSEGYSWVLRFEDSDGDVFLIGWLDDWGGALRVQANLGVDNTHGQAFLMMSTSDRLVFLSSMGATLSGMELDHTIAPRVEEGDDATPTPMNSPPASITISDTLLVDRSRYCSDFFSRYLRTRGALYSVRHMLTSMALLRRWG